MRTPVVFTVASSTMMSLAAQTALAEKAWGVVGEPGAAAASKDNAGAAARLDPQSLAAFRAAISQVENMPNNNALQQQAGRHGLNVLNVLWEDTGRSRSPMLIAHPTASLAGDRSAASPADEQRAGDQTASTKNQPGPAPPTACAAEL